MAAERKFKVGDLVWLRDWAQWMPPRGRKITGIVGRSYLIAALYGDGLGRDEKVGFAKADREYMTQIEFAELVYVSNHRYKIAERVRSLDAATLRKVAEVIGYKEGQ